MPEDSLKQLSKLLSYLLRHNPGALSLEMDAKGWVPIDQIIARTDHPVSRGQIEEVVRTSSKQRFSISPCGTAIRANQGHSIDVDLGLEPVQPPEILFHGTAETSLSFVLRDGLLPQGRQHVHLSKDTGTAKAVGMRHGKPALLQVGAAAMHAQGHEFYLSENGVWLCKSVPPRYLSVIPAAAKPLSGRHSS